jgi:HTH-type transcriptional regulator / antitoxin HigA
MISSAQTITQAWAVFTQQAQIERPRNQTEYEALLEVMNHVTDQIDTRGETFENSIFTPLFELIAAYLLEWELAHEPKPEPNNPVQTLKFLMQQHQLTQMELAVQMNVTQSHISKILSGQREIGKALAMQLGQRFGLAFVLFLA